jgi:hypothetical protein
MNEFIRDSINRMRDATIDVYNEFEDGIVFPPPELWNNMAVRFRSPAIVELTNSVQRAILPRSRDEEEA